MHTKPKIPFLKGWLQHKLQIIANTKTVKFEKVGPEGRKGEWGCANV